MSSRRCNKVVSAFWSFYSTILSGGVARAFSGNLRKKMKENWGKMRENVGEREKSRKYSFLAHPRLSVRLHTWFWVQISFVFFFIVFACLRLLFKKIELLCLQGWTKSLIVFLLVFSKSTENSISPKCQLRPCYIHMTIWY